MPFGKEARARRSWFGNRRVEYQIKNTIPLSPRTRKSLIARLWQKTTDSGHYPTDN